MRKSIVILAVVAAAAGGAWAQGAARPAKAGDVHVYAVELRTDRVQYEETVTVTGVAGEQITTRHVRTDRPQPTEGRYGTDWATLKSGPSGMQFTPAIPALRHPLQVGAKWDGTFEAVATSGARSRIKMDYVVAAQEKLNTPAGEFDTYRIETKGYLSGLSWQGGFAIQQRMWYAPAIDRIVRSEYRELRTMGPDNAAVLKQFKPAD